MTGKEIIQGIAERLIDACAHKESSSTTSALVACEACIEDGLAPLARLMDAVIKSRKTGVAWLEDLREIDAALRECEAAARGRQ